MPRGDARAFTRRGGTMLFICAIALALGSGSALGAQTVGQTGTAVSCGDDTSYFQRSVETGLDYAGISAGAITSYSTVAGPALKTRKLIVLADQGSNNWSVVQKDIVRSTATPSALNVFTGLHIPIQPGQRIGYFIPDQTVDGGDCLTFGITPNGPPDDEYRHAAGEPALGAATFFGAFATGGRINLSATIEPDADGDAFGDETQDGCPGNAAATGACPVAAPAAKKCRKKGRGSAPASPAARAAKKCKKRRKK